MAAPDPGKKLTSPGASLTRPGKRLKTPKVTASDLERRFFERYGRVHSSTAELDAFAASLSAEQTATARDAARARTDVVNKVLGHNLDERAREVSREFSREELLMRNPKFFRRMMREWKKEQPHGIHTLDRGQEWLPGNVIPNRDRKIRFRTKQEAIDFTQANKPDRFSAAVSAADLDAVVGAMVEAEERARQNQAAKTAGAGVAAADKAGDTRKTGPLYDYKFQRRAGEGFDAMMKRLESEVDVAADKQFAEARAARAQRAAERAQRATARAQKHELGLLDQLAAPTAPAKPVAPAAPAPVAPVAPAPTASTTPPLVTPAAKPAATTAAPAAPTAPANPAPATAAPRVDRWPSLTRQAEINRKNLAELDALSARIDADHANGGINDRFPEKSAYRQVWDDTKEDFRTMRFRNFRRAFRFFVDNDLGFGSRRSGRTIR